MPKLPRGALCGAALAALALAPPLAAQDDGQRRAPHHLVTLDVKPAVTSGPYVLSAHATAPLQTGDVLIWGAVAPLPPTSEDAIAKSDPALAPAADDRPREVALRPAFPNPSHARARIPFDLPTATHVRIAVYDLLGREVAVLADDDRPEGRHEVTLDAARLAAGVYHVRLTTGATTASQTLTIVR